MKEYILCAANHYEDGIERQHKPINITTGLVICGHRHHNCVQTFAEMKGFPYNEEALAIKRTCTEGFITNTNRFIGREEAAQLAFDTKMIKQHKVVLYSEDLY